MTRESLATRQATLDLAREIKAQNEGRFAAGVLAAYQIQDSLLGYSRRRRTSWTRTASRRTPPTSSAPRCTCRQAR